MTYSVKEIFYTLQGEGAHSGRPAVFLRFAGCNLWSGREKDRDSAVCRFCDTEFVGTDGPGGGKFSSPEDLAVAVAAHWPDQAVVAARPYVVCTGGEPLLQLDSKAVLALQNNGFEVAVETNGTIVAPVELDWICVSPKAGSRIRQERGHELKLVYPQDEAEAQPEQFVTLDFGHRFLQPLDDDKIERNTAAAIEYCLAHPEWKLSLQMHKITGLK